MTLPYPETSTIMSMTPSLLDRERLTSSISTESIQIDPLVMFQICDHYLRRKDGDDKVVGILLGFINSSDQLIITNCFGVRDISDLTTGINADLTNPNTYYRTAKSLHEKINKQESVVGWYSTKTIRDDTIPWSNLNISGLLRNDARLLSSPLMLILDCCDENQSLDYKLYRSDVKSFPKAIVQKLNMTSTFTLLYTEVSAVIKASDADKVALSAMVSENKNWGDAVSVAHIGNEKEQVQETTVSVEKTMELLDSIYQYVSNCVTNEKSEKKDVQETVARTLASIPTLSYENAADNLFVKNRRDASMINYLAKLTETQLCIAERISSGL